MAMPPNTTQMSLTEKLLLLQQMAEDDGRQWEANLIDQIITETPVVEIDNRQDPDYLRGEPRRAFIEKTTIPKVAITYRGWRFEMRSVIVPTMTQAMPIYIRPRKFPTDSTPVSNIQTDRSHQ